MLVTPELIERIERSEAECLRVTALASGGDVLEIGGGVAAFCGDGNPMTQVAAVGLSHEVSDEDLEAIFKHFEGRTTNYEFKVSPLTDQSLRERVVKRAKSIPEFETMLVCDLATHTPEPMTADIRPVQPEDYAAYAERAVTRFFSGEPIPPGLADTIAAACRNDGTHPFEVWVDGEPVASCALGVFRGVAWLQGAATDPEHRGKGLHKAMQAFRMAKAKEMGCTVLAQGALPGSTSQLNAQKSGLHIAFTRPTFYL